MHSKFFSLVSRLKNINRWSLMRNTTTESLQDHSYQTAVIANLLGEIAVNVYNKDIDIGKLTIMALYHDVPEIITSDIPTPVKYYSTEIRDMFNQLENTAIQSITELLPEEMQHDMQDILLVKEMEYYYLLKGADRLSALTKCIEERLAGNREFENAEKELKQALLDMKLPEVEYFLVEFLSSYGETLDELLGTKRNNKNMIEPQPGKGE